MCTFVPKTRISMARVAFWAQHSHGIEEVTTTFQFQEGCISMWMIFKPLFHLLVYRFSPPFKSQMAHILGVGTLWEEMGLLDTSSGTVKYTGPYACAAWRSLTGCPAGSCPPVEQSGGAGTAGSHWDEDALGTEVSALCTF